MYRGAQTCDIEMELKPETDFKTPKLYVTKGANYTKQKDEFVPKHDKGLEREIKHIGRNTTTRKI